MVWAFEEVAGRQVIELEKKHSVKHSAQAGRQGPSAWPRHNSQHSFPRFSFSRQVQAVGKAWAKWGPAAQQAADMPLHTTQGSLVSCS